MRVFEIRYNDGVFAEQISFDTQKVNEEKMEILLDEEIKEFNKNSNPDYHITRNNIKEIK